MAINSLSSVISSANDIGIDRAFVPVDIQQANVANRLTSAKGIVSVLAGSLNANGTYTAGPISVTVAGGTAIGRTMTDYSMALTGNTDTPIAAGNAAKYLEIYNPAGNATVLVSPSGSATPTAANSFPLASGGVYSLADGLSNAVTVKGTATQQIIVLGGK